MRPTLSIPADTSRVLELEEGTYILDEPIRLGHRAEFDVVRGAGMGLTTLQMKSAFSGPCIVGDSFANQTMHQDPEVANKGRKSHRCAVENLTCRFGGIEFDGSRALIQNVEVFDAPYGLLLGSNKFFRESKVEFCDLRRCDVGLKLTQQQGDKSNNNDFLANTIAFSHTHALEFDDGGRNKNMVGNRFFGGLIHGRSRGEVLDTPLVRVFGRVRELNFVATRFITGGHRVLFGFWGVAPANPERIWVDGSAHMKHSSRIQNLTELDLGSVRTDRGWIFDATNLSVHRTN